jgi:hypothetical protein
MLGPAPSGDPPANVPAPRNWGATAGEIRAGYPCDWFVDEPDEVWFRAVTVRAGRETVFRWLCQLKVAPYSYDLLDNLGRRSPRTLIEGAERLDCGQRVMSIFTLLDFRQADHLTIRMDSPAAVRLFGHFTISYVVRSLQPAVTRLIVKEVLTNGRGAFGTLRRRVLAWGDLLMMRRQLLTLCQLAERDAGPA